MKFGKFILAMMALVAMTSSAGAAFDTLAVYGNANDGMGSSFVDEGGDSYTITAGGIDFWGNSDQGAWLYNPADVTSGDFTAIVRSASSGGPDAIAPEWGRTGVMARANADANSANVITTQKSGGGVGMTFSGRNANGGGTDRGGPNGDFPDSAGGALGNGVPVWLQLSRLGGTFYGRWAFDDGGAPAEWSVLATRGVTADLAGDLLVGLAHQSHQQSIPGDDPQFNSVTFDNFGVGPFNNDIVGLSTETTPFVEVGPGPKQSAFGVRFVYYDELGDINNVGQAVDVLNSGDGIVEDGVLQTANTADIGGSPGGGYTLTAAKDPFLNNPTQGTDTNDVVWLYNGILDIPADGDYTFGIDGDDGQRLKVEGASFTKQAGGGAVQVEQALGGGDVFEFFGNTGDAFTTASTFLSAGQHRIQYLGYERGGGAFGELFSAEGVIGPDDDAQWLAIGSGESVEARTDILTPVIMTSDARVVNGDSIGTIGDPDAINRSRESVMTALADFINAPTGTASEITISSAEMPNGGGDNYTTGVFGEFAVVDTDGAPGEEITFTLRSDDGSQLHIIGQDFEAVGGHAQAALVEVNGDMALTAEYPTGNTDALGLINLEEGVYAFEVIHYEGGGGDYLDLYYAKGDQLAGFNSSFFPLSTNNYTVANFPANTALNLVPEPSSLALVGIGLFALLGLRRRNG